MWESWLVQIGKWSIPPWPKLEDGEAVEHRFTGPFTRLSLTDRRIIFSTFLSGDTVIQYDEVTRVEAGFMAGDVGTRENATTLYGIYIRYGVQEHEKLAWMANPQGAKIIICRRSTVNSPSSGAT